MIRSSRREAVAQAILDALLVACAYWVAYLLRFQLGFGELEPVAPAPPERYLQALPVVLGVFHLVLRSRGLYDQLPVLGIDAVELPMRAVTLATVVVVAATFFYREFSYSRAVCLIAWSLLVLALPGVRLVLLRRRRRRYGRGIGLVPTVVVGTGAWSRDLTRRLKEGRQVGLDVRGLVAPVDAAPEAALLAPELPVLGTLPELERVVVAHGIREVLVTDTIERLALFEVLEQCERLDVEARVVPCVHDLFVTADDLSEIHGVPFIAVRERRFRALSRLVKRGFDLVVGSALLLLSLPLLGLLALLIRRESRGPAVFVQRRVGEGGRVFPMLKLRSMVADAEARLPGLVDVARLAEPVFKLEGDPRVTPLGRFLRRWSLDELPQLWNVVRGDMSLVGPRPEEEAVVARYDVHQRRRLKAKPGLTGLQQVEARASSSLDERVRLDVFYIRRRTFVLDLWILARTPWAVLSGRGAH